MPALPSSSPAQFVQGAPVLHVADVEATAAFYRDVPGFTPDFGDERYAVVWRDNSAIHFVRDSGHPSGVHLFQWVKDVDAYHREIVRRGAVVAMEPTDQPYGIREFVIRDVNGVAIVFARTSITAKTVRRATHRDGPLRPPARLALLHIVRYR